MLSLEVYSEKVAADASLPSARRDHESGSHSSDYSSSSRFTDRKAGNKWQWLRGSSRWCLLTRQRETKTQAQSPKTKGSIDHRSLEMRSWSSNWAWFFATQNGNHGGRVIE